MRLAQIVAQAGLQRLALIGLAKNVGKTTTTSHLVATLLEDHLYEAQELALTSFGLDGERLDALTGLPKPRYRPQAGQLFATAASLLAQAEREGRFQRLALLPGRTQLGPVVIARVLEPGYVVIAGPTLLRDLRQALDKLQFFGAHLTLIDGAINRLGSASPGLTDACILCTGASAAPSAELVAKRTAEIVQRLSTPQTTWPLPFTKSHFRISQVLPGANNNIENYAGPVDPISEATWLVERTMGYEHSFFFLHRALTEELGKEILRLFTKHKVECETELIIEDATKIFCHTALLQQLADRGLTIRVATPIRILAVTINPYTPEYSCTTQNLLTALHKALPDCSFPFLDVKVERPSTR